MGRRESHEPITADDATLERALADAHIPSLMVSLVHVTGDVTPLRGEIRPVAGFFGDPQAGITEAQQAEVRAAALAALRAYRDRGCTLPPPPSQDTIRELMNFTIGSAVPDEYTEFLTAELSLAGEDPFAPQLDDLPEEQRSGFHVVVIGAGMSGLLAAIRLAEAGIPHVVIEKNSEVGGTWWENSYPGCRVDSPNHTYAYSFEPYDWPQPFCERSVLLDYFKRVAGEYGVRDRIRFETEVRGATYDDETGRWQVHVEDREGRAETIEASAIISAVGQLNRPRFPDLKGRETFEGISFHSAEWEHEHDLRGKRIAVIGTGASAFQFVPEIAKEAGEVIVFQRTPPWIAPTPDYHDLIPEGTHWLFRHVPYYAKWFRFWVFWNTAEGVLAAARKDPEWSDECRSISSDNDQLRVMLTEFITDLVGDDPELLAKAIPDYPPAGKRMLRDNGHWFRALQRDNVRVVTEPIEEITPRGLRTESGETFEVDALIYGTGFLANRFLWPMKITGRDGVDLAQQWREDPRAYLGITIPGFPNLFCLYGPNTNIVVNGSITFFSECEVRYITGCIGLLLEKGCRAMEPRREVHDAYNRLIDAGNAQMAWGAPNVTSWYKNRAGRVTQNWPFTLLEFWTRTRAPDPSDFTFL